MAQREYVYARRVWRKADDGGLYCVQRACAQPAPPPAGCRTVRVEDFAGGLVVRCVPGIYDPGSPAAELASVYFEDSKCNARIVNLAVKKVCGCCAWPRGR
mmetsp:Transcript_32411/g.96786  ORF Transcript_32411/g.96786 Transcript_32411/m.96786 type:complete len:101 (-) Transcript_32411:879-1181(-)